MARDQQLALQLDALAAAGCGKVFEDGRRAKPIELAPTTGSELRDDRSL